MIHELPSPIHGATHIQVLHVQERPGASLQIEGRLGTLDGEAFQANPYFRPHVVSVPLSEVTERAEAQGGRAPDYRREDWTAVLDARGWTNEGDA